MVPRLSLVSRKKSNEYLFLTLDRLSLFPTQQLLLANCCLLKSRCSGCVFGPSYVIVKFSIIVICKIIILDFVNIA